MFSLSFFATAQIILHILPVMTITFIPGEVNKGTNSSLHALWKSHYLVAYGLGNNLIISSTLKPDRRSKLDLLQRLDNLQTIYLLGDLGCVVIDGTTGYIAVSVKSTIIIFKPENEFLSRPRWTQGTTIINEDDNSNVNCMDWATIELELCVGTAKSISLHYIFDNFGETCHRRRWYCPQPSSVTKVKITANANKIVSVSNHYDNLLKVWSRANYGDETTQFDVSYLPHPPGTYAVEVQWRYKIPSNSITKVTDKSMANIKNIRDYIDNLSDDCDTLYTITNEGRLTVWASYEYSDHSHIKAWSHIDLGDCFEDKKLLGSIIIDNYHLQRTVVPALNATKEESNITRYLQSQDLKTLDLLLAIGTKGNIVIFAMVNAGQDPPNSIRFDRIDAMDMRLDDHCFPTYLNVPNVEPINVDTIQSLQFRISQKNLVISKICTTVEGDVSPKVAVMIHDRFNNTLRLLELDFARLLRGNTGGIGARLVERYQGHTKSIRKLFKSSFNNGKPEVLLSILNFAEHNYIWEPLILESQPTCRLSITKRTRLGLEECQANEKIKGAWSALIVNDVNAETEDRRHLIVVFEKCGFVSVWNCVSCNADRVATLAVRFPISQDDKTKKSEPFSVLLFKLPDTEKGEKRFGVIAIFDTSETLAWTLNTDPVEMEKVEIDRFPKEDLHLVASIDSDYLDMNESLVSAIDTGGRLLIYGLDLKDIASKKLGWTETAMVHTNIEKAGKIHGAARVSRFAVIDSTGTQLSIWDTKNGVLEYEESFEDEVRDLDWTYVGFNEGANNLQHDARSSSVPNAILSVGFRRHVLLYTQLRYDYTNKIPPFAVLKKIDISDFTTHEIGDLIWLANGYLVIASGNQFFIDDKYVDLGSSESFVDQTLRQLMVGYIGNEDVGKRANSFRLDIDHLVKILNGPLPLYHPQFLIQSLFFLHTSLVKSILFQLFKILRVGKMIEWDLGLSLDEVIVSEHPSRRESRAATPDVHELFNGQDNSTNGDLDVFSEFNDQVAHLLVERLSKSSLPLLTRHQQITLISVINIVRELQVYHESLDDNGLRFFIGFKLFQTSSKQSRLTMRDINWALHSDNKEVILTMIQNHYKNRLRWEHITQTGIPYWLETSRLSSVLESCARNEFGDSRDPSGRITLFYLAIRKKHVLTGLWRTVSHPEKQKMLAFMNNNFSEDRWRKAALKNAFVLLGKHRYVDAASFFLLGDSVKDACQTIAFKLRDVPLAIAIAKVYTSKDSVNSDEPVSDAERYIIEDFVVPEAGQTGNRWLSSWTFWELNEKELAIQALVKPPIAIFKENGQLFSDRCYKFHIEGSELTSQSKSYLQDDPVLGLLFDSLRQKSVRYLRGYLMVPLNEEFDFTVKICSLYTRMGCDYLAILLVRLWTFIEYDEHKGIMKKTKAEKSTNQLENGKGTIRSMLQSFEDSGRNDAKAQPPPPPTAFEEPDMSAFDFGF